MKVLGLVKLAPGEVGFYDELTRIHLTIANPERHILSNMNTTNIKKSVRSGRLLLISGSLEPEKVVSQTKPTETKGEKKEDLAAAKAEAEKLEAIKAEELAAKEAEEAKVKEAEEAAKAEAEAKKAEEAEAKKAEEAEVVVEEVKEEKAPVKKAAPKKTAAKKTTAKKAATKE